VSILLRGYTTCHQPHWYHLPYQSVLDSLSGCVSAYAVNHSGETTTVRPPLSTSALHLCWNKDRSVDTSTALLSASNIHVRWSLVVILCIQAKKQTHIMLNVGNSLQLQCDGEIFSVGIFCKAARVIILLFRSEILGFHRGDNEDGYSTQGCDAVKFDRWLPTFWRNLLLPSSWLKSMLGVCHFSYS